ncbi:MAG: ABC transporter permease [Thermoanaerobaculia bacterium]
MAAAERFRAHRELWRAMRRDAHRAPRLALRRLRHDLVTRYRTSRLGLAVAFVPAIVVTLWATLAYQARVITVGSLAIPYPAWVLLSVVLWQVFVEALTSQVDGLAAERQLLAKVDLPAEALILARLGETLVQYALKLVLVVVVLLLFKVRLAPTALLLPLLALPIAAFGTACGLCCAPLAALVPDLARALPALTTVAFFLTPVVFPVPQAGVLRFLVLANPVTPLLGFARDLAVAGILSHPAGALGAATLTALLLPAGWFFYRLALPYVFERNGG